MLRRIQRKQDRREHRKKSRLKRRIFSAVALILVVLGVLTLNHSCNDDGHPANRAVEGIFINR